MTSIGDDRGRGLPSFLPLAQTSLLDFIWLLHLWQQKASLSRLMVATQKVGGKDDMRTTHQGRLDSDLTCRKQWLQLMPKLL
jgi:hypothetical protein